MTANSHLHRRLTMQLVSTSCSTSTTAVAFTSTATCTSAFGLNATHGYIRGWFLAVLGMTCYSLEVPSGASGDSPSLVCGRVCGNKEAGSAVSAFV